MLKASSERVLEMRCDIYVTFTSYQLRCVLDIIAQRPPSLKVLVTTVEPKSASKQNFDQIHFFNKINGLRKLLQEVVNRKRRKVFNNLLKTSTNCSQLNLFIPHYFNINANHLATQFYPKANIHLFPDGLLSYYPYRISRADAVKQLFIKIAALGMGLKYRPFFSVIANPFGEVSSIYSYDPATTWSYGKTVHAIQYKKETLPSFPANQGNMLILGTAGKVEHPYRLAINIAKLANKVKPEIFYYKSHPSMKEDPFFNLLKKEISGITMIHSKRGAEELITSLGILDVVSACLSTAIIEIRMKRVDGIRCYCNELSIKHNIYRKYFDKLCSHWQIVKI